MVVNNFDGKNKKAIVGDFRAIWVKAGKADGYGNVGYRHTASKF